MSDSKVILPVEQKKIEFHGDAVIAILAPDETVYVPVRPLCELLGIQWSAQSKRIKRDPVLSDVCVTVSVSVTDTLRTRDREMIALPLDYLNGWLFGISATRVNESIRETLIRYQRDCYRVLYEAFGRNDVTTRPDNELMQSSDPSAIAFRNALSMARLARQQYYLSKQVEDNTHRIGLLEAQFANPAGIITQAEAQQIASAVKAVAMGMAQKFSGNHFGRVYAELYTRYGITEYKMLPSGRYNDAIQWLRDWWIDISGNDDVSF